MREALLVLGGPWPPVVPAKRRNPGVGSSWCRYTKQRDEMRRALAREHARLDQEVRPAPPPEDTDRILVPGSV